MSDFEPLPVAEPGDEPPRPRVGVRARLVAIVAIGLGAALAWATAERVDALDTDPARRPRNVVTEQAAAFPRGPTNVPKPRPGISRPLVCLVPDRRWVILKALGALRKREKKRHREIHGAVCNSLSSNSV